MKVLEFKNYKNVDKKSLNKRKVTISLMILLIIILLVIMIALYVGNKSARDFMDKYLLGKNVSEDSLPSIEINSQNSIQIYAYDKYVVTLEKNILKHYTSNGKEESSIDVSVGNPIFDSNGKYMVLAEKGKQKVYLIANGKIIWEKDAEGTISRVNVNENGYVSIIVTGTTYKSVISIYDLSGKELFKTYLSNTSATDATISNDNKYLSFIEIDTSATLIQTKVKTVSIEDAKQSPQNSIINTYNIGTSNLVVNIKYQKNNNLLCLCDDKILVLKDGNMNEIVNLADTATKITFSDINLNQNVYKIEEVVYGVLNQASNVEIINTETQKQNIYTIDGVAKEVESCDKVIAVNVGSEVYFIDMNGWLIKKYTSDQEVKNIVVSNQIAGIIYKDKIEFLGL